MLPGKVSENQKKGKSVQCCFFLCFSVFYSILPSQKVKKRKSGHISHETAKVSGLVKIRFFPILGKRMWKALVGINAKNI